MIPQPPLVPSPWPFAHAYSFRRDPLAFMTSLARDYGDIAHYEVGPNQFYYIHHPELIKDLLVTQDKNFIKYFNVERTRSFLGNGLFVSEGEFHTRQRRIAQPFFHRQRIASYAEQIVRLTEQLTTPWKNGETRDISKDMNWVTMVIAAQTLFGTEFFAETEEVRVALNEILEEFDHTMLPPGDSEEFQTALQRLDAPIYKMIKSRSANFEEHDDLLSSLMQVHLAEGSAKDMTLQQLRDEAMTIFIAGHETTANALTWTWYLLSLHPEIEQALHEEIATVLGDRLPTFDDVPKLALAERIFAESLRLYPPLWIIGRQATAECKIGPYLVPAGAYCFVSPYVMQHDARYFPEPEKFDPDRWLPEAKAARPKYCYFPFSGGSRSCLGENFAWMEGALIIAAIAQKWRLAHDPNQTIKLQTNLTLRSRYGMGVTLHART